MTVTGTGSRILTLVFTDLADSTALKTRHGDELAGELIARHRELVRGTAAESGGRIIDWAGDGCFLTFPTASLAVTFALQLQQAHCADPELPGVRAGLHMGEVSEHLGPGDSDAHPRIEGLAVDLAARIANLARPEQVLMSAAVADSARQRIGNRVFDQAIRWQSHGNYTLKGFDEPLEIREAGLEGIASFRTPSGSAKASPFAHGRPSRWRRIGALQVLAVFIVAGAIGGYVVWSEMLEPSATSSRAEVVPSASGQADAIDFGERPAIAVLPFDNMSADPDQAFFADGLAEDLITRLSTWRAFPVIARNSSFQYRGGNHDLKQVGGELGARYVVEGSVRRAGDQIRVTVQLIDAESGEHVWARAYDRKVTDVFELQDEISGTVAASLVEDLTRAEGERARQRGTHNLAAWGLYQLGLQHFDKYTLEGFAEARRLFERAATLDPRFATALGYYAIAGASELILGRGGPREDFVAGLTANARRAVALDPRDPVAHCGLGAAFLSAGDMQNALESTRRGIDLNPSMPEAWIWLGFNQILAGDPASAIVATERAQRLNPQGSMVWIHDNFALAYWEVGRYAEALESGRQLVALQPTYFPGYAYIAMNNVALGRLDDARAAIAEGRRINPGFSLALIQGYLGVSRPAVDARRNAALREAGLE
jgi:adenylate cyclase